jgi:hypothetical protein
MKKYLFPLLIILFIPVVCYGGEERVKKVFTMRSFSAADVSFDQAHVCDAQSFDCRIPEKLITSFPVLNIQFFAPDFGTYHRHYIIADTAGTFVIYEFFSTFESAGTISFELDEQSLPDGDYIFTAIVVGPGNNAAISDPYRFSVLR